MQAPAYLYGLSALGVPESAFILGKGPLFIISSVIILVTGTIFAMWLGEKITDKGIVYLTFKNNKSKLKNRLDG